MHFLYLYLLKGDMMTKMESLLALYMFICRWECDALFQSVCRVTSRSQHHDYYEKKCTLWWSLCWSLPICWYADPMRWIEGQGKVSIFNFPIFVFLLLPFIKSGLFVFEFKVQEFLKFGEKKSDLFELNFSLIKSIVKE